MALVGHRLHYGGEISESIRLAGCIIDFDTPCNAMKYEYNVNRVLSPDRSIGSDGTINNEFAFLSFSFPPFFVFPVDFDEINKL